MSSYQLARCGYLSHLSWHLSKSFLRLIGTDSNGQLPYPDLNQWYSISSGSDFDKFPSISAALPPLQSVLLTTTSLSKWTSLWLLSENHLIAVESGISLKPTGRVSKQPSNLYTGLPSLLSPTSTHHGNSFKETCSPSCTDLSPLVFSCPTLPPALGSLKLVARQLS